MIVAVSLSVADWGGAAPRRSPKPVYQRASPRWPNFFLRVCRVGHLSYQDVGWAAAAAKPRFQRAGRRCSAVLSCACRVDHVGYQTVRDGVWGLGSRTILSFLGIIWPLDPMGAFGDGDLRVRRGVWRGLRETYAAGGGRRRIEGRGRGRRESAPPGLWGVLAFPSRREQPSRWHPAPGTTPLYLGRCVRARSCHRSC